MQPDKRRKEWIRTKVDSALTCGQRWEEQRQEGRMELTDRWTERQTDRPTDRIYGNTLHVKITEEKHGQKETDR